MFAEAYLEALELQVLDTTRHEAPFDFMNGSSDIPSIRGPWGSSSIDGLYTQLVGTIDRLVPFYRYFFPFYRLNKKCLVLQLMSQLSVYDDELF